MRVGVQLDLNTALELHKRLEASRHSGPRTASAADAILDAARELGITVTPVHPGQTHELLAPYFFVEVRDLATAQTVAKRLQQVKGVDGAWVRSSDDLP
jgi:hypothetical protein